MRPSHALCVALFALTACRSDHQLGADQRDPSLVIESPERAAWEAPGAIEVTGTAINLDEVRVNGQPTTRDGDTFTGEVTLERGMNLVQARGLDPRGDARIRRHGVLAGEFAPPAGNVRDAGVIRLNQGGIDVVLDAAEREFSSDVLAAQLTATNPLYQDSFAVEGNDLANVAVDVDLLSYTDLQLEGAPGNGQLTVSATFWDFELGLSAYGDVVGVPYDQSVEMGAQAVNIVASLSFDAHAGRLEVELLDAALTFDDLWWDLDVLPSDIVENLLADTVEALLEDQLVGAIEDQIPALLEEQLAGLELDFETEILDVPVGITAEFASASVDPQGLEIGMDIGVSVQGDAGYAYPGYLVAPAAEPDPSHVYDLAMSLHDDLINRVLFETWKGGLLERTLSTDDDSLPAVVLLPLDTDEGTLNIRADLPPVIIERAGGLVAQVAELELEILTPGGELGERLVVAVAADVPVELTADDNVVTLTLGTPDLVLTVRESDWGASNEATTALIEEMLPMDLLLSFLDEFAFPLPDLAGVRIRNAAANREITGVHTGVKASLALEETP